jgi:hypothetical protein
MTLCSRGGEEVGLAKLVIGAEFGGPTLYGNWCPPPQFGQSTSYKGLQASHRAQTSDAHFSHNESSHFGHGGREG